MSLRRGLAWFFLFALLSCSVEAQVNRTGLGGGVSTSSSIPTSSLSPRGSEPRSSSNDAESDTAQSNPTGIDYDHVEEADSVLCNAIHFFEPLHHAVKVSQIEQPVLDPTGVEFADVLDALDGDYFLSRGGLGTAHLSLFPSFGGNMGFCFQRDVNAGLIQSLGRPTLFQVQRPYSVLGFGSSLHKDYQLKVLHSQNIRPRWNVAIDADLISRQGVYMQSGVKDVFFNATTNYYSSDARYQLEAGIVRNKLTQEENGGVANDQTCWQASNRSGVPVNLYGAANEWRQFSFFVHQSYNTVRQFQLIRPIVVTFIDTVRTEHDSISPSADSIRLSARDSVVGFDTILPHRPHVLNSGVFALDLHYDNHKHNFYDTDPSASYYPHFYYDSLATYDSTRVRTISADLYWTNDAYMDHRWHNPATITIGIRPEATHILFTDSVTTESIFYIEAYAEGRLSLKGFQLQLKAATLNNGDYKIMGGFSWKDWLQAEVISQATCPDYIYYRYISNSYQWFISDYRKIGLQQAAVCMQKQRPDSADGVLRAIKFRALGSLISHNVWFDSLMRPTQGDATGLLMQASFNASLSKGWFRCETQQMLQYSSNNEVVRVPLFASKNSLYADVQVFGGALHLQTGFDIRYHTKYYADGWSPALGAFYRQDEVQVGNYLWADFFASIQVKQASLYVKVVHFNAPLEKNPHYFLLPHHPGEDLAIYYGVIWKFFN